MCMLGALQRQVDLQGMFVKIGDFIKFKGFLVEFLENKWSRGKQKPPENRQKSGLLWASPFTMHLVWTLLIDSCGFRTVPCIDCQSLAGERPSQRKELTMNQSKATLLRSRNLKGLVFSSPDWEPRNSRKNALGVKWPFSELSESSGVFLEQLSEFRKWVSECAIPSSEWHLTTWAIQKPQFSERLPERFPKLTATRMKDPHLPVHSRTVFQDLGWCLRARKIAIPSSDFFFHAYYLKSPRPLLMCQN